MYCTVEDIIQQTTEATLKEWTRANDRDEQYDKTLVTRAIEDQSAYIDSCLKGRYPLPIFNTDDLKLLKLICVRMVCYELATIKIQNDIPEAIAAKRDGAIKDLEKIQKGLISLHIEGSEVKPTGVRSRVSKRIQYFTGEQGLRGY